MDFDNTLTWGLKRLVQQLHSFRLASFDRAWSTMVHEHFPEQELRRPRRADVPRERLGHVTKTWFKGIVVFHHVLPQRV